MSHELGRQLSEGPVVIRHIYGRDATLSPGALTLLKVR